MDGVSVQSRFAGLKIEDDEYPASNDNQKAKKIKTNTAKKSEPPKKSKTNNNKSQTASKKKKSKQDATLSDQWELWKQKDEEMVDGNYETELQQAILLSKLDYEEKKDVYKQMKKEAEIEKKLGEQASRTGTKKQKKKNVMSLDQFNDMVNAGEESKFNHEDEKDSPEHPRSPKKDTEFFERVKDDTKNELLKDKIKDRVRNRQNVSEEVMTRVKYAGVLKEKDEEIAKLQQEVETLKQELHEVKTRNKKLCNILGQGEMKDKAEVLVEMERLRAVQAELTAELETLHTDLERERSRNTDPRAKDKKHSTKKKNIRFDVSSEAILTKESSSGTS